MTRSCEDASCWSAWMGSGSGIRMGGLAMPTVSCKLVSLLLLKALTVQWFILSLVASSYKCCCGVMGHMRLLNMGTYGSVFYGWHVWNFPYYGNGLCYVYHTAVHTICLVSCRDYTSLRICILYGRVISFIHCTCM